MSASSILSGKVSKKPTASKDAKPRVPVPKKLEVAARIMVMGKIAAKAVGDKVKLAEKRCKEFALGRFCDEFAKTGKMPNMETYEVDDEEWAFGSNNRVTLDTKKVEKVKTLGVDLEEIGETELVSLTFHISALKKHDYMKKFGKFLDTIDEKHTSDVITRGVVLKDGFLDRIPEVAKKATKVKGSLADKIKALIENLGVGTAVRNTKSPSDKNECFSYAVDTELPSEEQGDLMEAVQKSKKGGKKRKKSA